MKSVKYIFFTLSMLLLFSVVGNSKVSANVYNSQQTESKLLILKSEPVFRCVFSNASFHIKDDLRLKEMDQDSDDYFISPLSYSGNLFSQNKIVLLSVFHIKMTRPACVNTVQLYILFNSLNIP